MCCSFKFQFLVKLFIMDKYCKLKKTSLDNNYYYQSVEKDNNISFITLPACNTCT